MDNQAILTKAINQAIDGGYHTWEFSDKYTKEDELKYLLGTLYDDPEENGNVQSVEALIFNHDFAKALWGNKSTRLKQVEVNRVAFDDIDAFPEWEVRLMEMVIAENPLDYLKDNI